ncbi:MAG TPA: ACT domain-containing protein [Hyphomicrobiaceae bacterium]|mgnify:CR=1 FL=1|nr:ACT domain-containing protein [Hyphomicrobiaceae bacterium]
MAQEMVLTVIARDRPGLIKALSETIDSHAGNWIDSSMARLGGEFAGIVRIAVPDENASALEGALGALGDAGIWVTIRRGESVGVRSDEPARHISISLTGVDHPGIIHEVSAALAALEVSIDELNSRIFIGSMSGEAMFEATADIVLPADCDLAKLRSTIEGLANDLMVDVELHSLDSNDALD